VAVAQAKRATTSVRRGRNARCRNKPERSHYSRSRSRRRAWRRDSGRVHQYWNIYAISRLGRPVGRWEGGVAQGHLRAVRLESVTLYAVKRSAWADNHEVVMRLIN
jgi:hypothetical protein